MFVGLLLLWTRRDLEGASRLLLLLPLELLLLRLLKLLLLSQLSL